MNNANENKQLLVFGYGLPAICAFFAWRQYVKHDGLTFWADVFMATGVFVLMLVLLKSPWLKIIFRYWMRAAKFIGSILTVVLLTVIYGLVFTPMALCLRLAGKDYMRRKSSKEVRSYWIDRLPEDHQQQTKQF